MDPINRMGLIHPTIRMIPMHHANSMNPVDPIGEGGGPPIGLSGQGVRGRAGACGAGARRRRGIRETFAVGYHCIAAQTYCLLVF